MILRDGFQTWIFVSNNLGPLPSISALALAALFPALPAGGIGPQFGNGLGGILFEEKEVTPPDVDAGGVNDTTTMRRTAWRTRQPKRLKTLDKMMVKGAYDASVYNATTIGGYIGRNTQIVCLFPDFTDLYFWGWLNKFTPDALKEGEMPLCDLEFFASNQNNSGTEVTPVQQANGAGIPTGFTFQVS